MSIIDACLKVCCISAKKKTLEKQQQQPKLRVISYFPAHKHILIFSLEFLEKRKNNDERILILVI
jgi:hypothetical protein